MMVVTTTSNAKDVGNRYPHANESCLIILVSDYPRGYPKLGAYLNSDDNRHLCRRFGYTRSRLILYVQDEIQELEERLAEIDARDAAGQATQYALNSRRWDEDHSVERKNVIANLKTKLKEYDDLILREHQILKIARPTKKNHRYYFNFIWEEKPLCRKEYEFIFQEDDTLDLAAEPETEWLWSVVEVIIKVLPRGLLKV